MSCLQGVVVVVAVVMVAGGVVVVSLWCGCCGGYGCWCGFVVADDPITLI